MNKKRIIITVVMMLCIIGLGLGITRALFKYVKEGLNQQIIAGDIYMKEVEGAKVVSNIKPMDVEEGKKLSIMESI